MKKVHGHRTEEAPDASEKTPSPHNNASALHDPREVPAVQTLVDSSTSEHDGSACSARRRHILRVERLGHEVAVCSLLTPPVLLDLDVRQCELLVHPLQDIFSDRDRD